MSGILWVVFVKDLVLYCLRTRQRARRASRALKARGKFAALVPSDTVAPNSFHWYNTSTWYVAQTTYEGTAPLTKN